MTFPDVDLSQLWAHPSLQSDATMHPDVDTNLNLAAQRWRSKSPGPHLRVANRAGGAIGASVNFPFEIVREDTAAGWSAVSSQYTIPKDGLWLASFRIQTSTAATGTPQGWLSGVNTGRGFAYGGSSFAASRGTSGGYGQSFLPPVPLHCYQGDVLAVSNRVAFTAISSAALDRNYFELTWLADV